MTTPVEVSHPGDDGSTDSVMCDAPCRSGSSASVLATVHVGLDPPCGVSSERCRCCSGTDPSALAIASSVHAVSPAEISCGGLVAHPDLVATPAPSSSVMWYSECVVWACVNVVADASVWV